MCYLDLVLNQSLCSHRRLSQRPTTEELEQRNILKRKYFIQVSASIYLESEHTLDSYGSLSLLL